MNGRAGATVERIWVVPSELSGNTSPSIMASTSVATASA
jgi:hypothetical protein